MLPPPRVPNRIGCLCAAERRPDSPVSSPISPAPFDPISLPTQPAPSLPTIGILTVSDRASDGTYEDRSGPAIESVLGEYLATEVQMERRVVADEQPQIQAVIQEFAAAGAALVVVTGGTGPARRDVTPEAIDAVCTKELPGFGEQMRAASLAVGVPTAILSRQTAAILQSTLVVTLPGKPEAIRVCLDAVFPAIPYCIDLIGGPYLEGRPEAVAVFRPAHAQRAATRAGEPVR